MKKTLDLESAKNKRLCIYNMFPRRYSSISQMIHHLPDIKACGFNVVWLNPIHQATVDRYHSDNRTRSLYAMVDTLKYAEFLPDASDEMIIAFTDRAKQLGIIPMFDLVICHIGRGSQIIDQHPEFFKLHDQSNYSDVVAFNYDSMELFEQIFEIFWKPFIDKYLKLGFTGVRVDQAKPDKLPPAMQKRIYDYMKGVSDIACVVFAEVLFDGLRVEDVSRQLTSTGITHITNSLYWVACDSVSLNNKDWNKGDNTLREIGYKTLVCEGNGGTIGFGGFHDGLTVACKVHEKAAYQSLNLPSKTKEAKKKLKSRLMVEGVGSKKYVANLVNDNYLYQIITQQFEVLFRAFNADAHQAHQRLIKQKLAMVALTSDGGWYLISGDEYGCTSHCSVFKENYFGGTDLDAHWGGRYDFRVFIHQLNSIVQRLPPVEPGEWCEHFSLEERPDIFIIFKHFKNYPSQAIVLNIGFQVMASIDHNLHLHIAALSASSKNLTIEYSGVEVNDKKQIFSQ